MICNEEVGAKGQKCEHGKNTSRKSGDTPPEAKAQVSLPALIPEPPISSSLLTFLSHTMIGTSLDLEFYEVEFEVCWIGEGRKDWDIY